MAAKTKSFEEMIAELEQITDKLESGDAPLDEAVALFEKGMKLSVKCQSQLEQAEQKIKVLTEGKDGEVLEALPDGGEEA